MSFGFSYMPSETAEYSRIMLFVFWKEQPENTKIHTVLKPSI